MRFLIMGWILVASVAFGQAQSTKFFSTKGVAINGFDPVAYFVDKKATEGNDNYIYQWSGSSWKFSSQANLNQFKLNPEKYAPQFAGYCAYGCSENHKSPSDPRAWTIVDNKLYLNYNVEVKKMWMVDNADKIKKANTYWSTQIK